MNENVIQQNAYERILNKLVVFFAIIAGIALSIMMFITAFDVILRFTGNAIIGAFEVVELLMGIVVPLALAYCEKKREHICVDLIVQHFPKKSQPWFDLITSTITFLFYIVITWQCFINVMAVHEDELTTSVLLLQIWPYTIPCVIGFALTTLLLINHCRNVFKQIRLGTYGA